MPCGTCGVWVPLASVTLSSASSISHLSHSNNPAQGDATPAQRWHYTHWHHNGIDTRTYLIYNYYIFNHLYGMQWWLCKKDVFLLVLTRMRARALGLAINGVCDVYGRYGQVISWPSEWVQIWSLARCEPGFCPNLYSRDPGPRLWRFKMCALWGLWTGG